MGCSPLALSRSIYIEKKTCLIVNSLEGYNTQVCRNEENSVKYLSIE